MQKLHFATHDGLGRDFSDESTEYWDYMGLFESIGGGYERNFVVAEIHYSNLPFGLHWPELTSLGNALLYYNNCEVKFPSEKDYVPFSYSEEHNSTVSVASL